MIKNIYYNIKETKCKLLLINKRNKFMHKHEDFNYIFTFLH